MRYPSELRTGQFIPSSNNWRTDLLFPRFDILGPRNRRTESGGLPPGYFQEGFLAIQNAIAAQFLRMKSGAVDLMPEISIQVCPSASVHTVRFKHKNSNLFLQRYPYPPYVRDVLLTGLETLVSLIILLSFV